MPKRVSCKPVYTVLKPRRDSEWNEWVTVVKKNGKRDEGKTNYTDDKADAFGTYELQKEWARKENERLCQRRGK